MATMQDADKDPLKFISTGYNAFKEKLLEDLPIMHVTSFRPESYVQSSLIEYSLLSTPVLYSPDDSFRVDIKIQDSRPHKEKKHMVFLQGEYGRWSKLFKPSLSEGYLNYSLEEATVEPFRQFKDELFVSLKISMAGKGGFLMDISKQESNKRNPYVLIHRAAQGTYSKRGGDFPAFFKDVKRETKENLDFRPWVHRSLEVMSKTPSEFWHNPIMYTNPAEIVLERSLEILCEDQQKQTIKDQIRKSSQLQLFEFESVPRLNLGAFLLPDNRIGETEVLEAAPLVIENLSRIGIMSREEAENLYVKKLTSNYLSKGFQQSRRKAKRILKTIY